MVVDIKYEIEKHGSAEKALMFALCRLNGYAMTQSYLMQALRDAGVDADKLLADMPRHP
jgi:hypothetical protein